MRRACLVGAVAVLAGCNPLAMASAPKAPEMAAPTDPTPLAKCKVAASATSPLVTEWPASQKAYLEGLTSRQAVAVAYSGCELRIVDACRLPGKYTWHRTTPATDTLEITNADELWAKLPIGAAGLEGELARNGRLAVRTTISGQLELDGLDAKSAATDASCAGVTHVVSAVSVGAFRLLSGAGASAQGGAKAFGVGAGGSTSREESVLREAGDPNTCGEGGESAPQNCASPIQLFLQPVQGGATQAAATTAVAASSPMAIEVTFPATDDRHWALHDANGTILCDAPCTKSVPPGSGWYLESTKGSGGSTDHLDLPARLPYSPGSRAVADYRAERGAPFLSTLTFWGLGVPAAIGGAVAVSFGIGNVGGTSDQSLSGFWIGTGILYLAIAGATAWWYFWSHPASFDTHAAQ
ncbi:MAG TPA: hypothetical protein VF765_29100 [Polyangiaceae bacterium]